MKHLEEYNETYASHFKFAIKKTIQFFENIEDYEKCVFLKEIQDKVLLSLAKDVPS